MDLKTFLENFEAIAEAPGGIPKLRSLILDLAVRGNLVPQNPEEEPADELFKNIQESREVLYSKRKASRKKDFLPLNCDEIPFSIPRTWKWARLHELCWLITDGTHHTPTYVESGIPFLSVKDVSGGYLDFSNTRFITREAHEELCARCNPEYGDILLTKVGTTGIAVEIDIVQEFSIFVSVALLKHFPTFTSPKFLTYLLNSSFVKAQSKAGTEGVGNKNLVLKKIYNFVVPLPPLAEQKRIVEKVDELMALCDRYEAAKQTRDNLRQKLRESAIASLMNAETDEELDAAWAIVRDNWCEVSQCPEDVDDLRQAVLNLAVRGKLVSQNINDESVLDLLAKITDEKKSLIEAKKIRDASTLPFEDSAFPCEIPDTWAWKRFGDVILDIEAGTSPQCEKRPKNGNEWGVIKISAVSWNKFNPDENKALPANVKQKKEFEIKINDFIMSRANTSQLVGKSVIVEHSPPRLLLNDKTLRVLFPSCIEKRFFNLYNNSVLARQYYAGEGTGTSDSMKNITREQIRNLPVPVPPLHEQKRIVAKVNELMQLCDQLEASLRQSQQWAESLAASAISHLTI